MRGTGARSDGAVARPPGKSSAGAPHKVRIIGGQWKRTPLAVPDAPGLRPTPDRIRETVFNWLEHLIGGAWSQKTCLDLFAGSGALGFEAASRGAAKVVLVESFPQAVRAIQATREKLHAAQVQVVQGDAQRQLGQPGSPQFDLIFLDPPYHQDWLPRLLPRCAAQLAPGGIVYAEAEMPLHAESGAWMAGWEVVRSGKAGMVYYHLLVRNPEPSGSPDNLGHNAPSL